MLATALALAGGAFAALPAASPSSASDVGTLRARAAEIAARLAVAQLKLQVLSEEYDQAQLRAASLHASVERDRAALLGAGAALRRTSTALREDAVAAYVSGGGASDLSVVMTGSASSLQLRQTYLDAAAGSLSTAATSFVDSRHRFAVREQTLRRAESAANATERTLWSSKRLAARLISGLDAAEAAVKGQLAAAVAEQLRLQQAEQAARAAAARRAAATLSLAISQPPPPSPALVPTPAVGGQGEAAVHAAESQLGVPYVWAGATPGVGFDCSGLTMWAWAQAGVSLPHSAQAQYDSIEHVSLSDLQPGDLIFYASGGYIYHVIMYIGGGEAIQAEETGTVIQVTPVWPGAYGAGRP